VSLIDKATGRNLFNDADAEFGLSDLARNFLAGMLKHARATTIFTAPTINCYKRYRVNSFAPNSATWGMENRTVGIRIKACRGESTHLENRLACGSANPYLLALSTLAAGLEGIQSRPVLPAPVMDIAYGRQDIPPLPTSLEEAVAEFENDEELHAVLGPELVKLVLAVKKFEVETARKQFPDYGTTEFNNRVDPWEWDYFMELV
jgi:glutamine synthetase